MIPSSALKNPPPPVAWPRGPDALAGGITPFQLSDKYQREVLAFLARRPLQTVMMSGMIRDNGLASPLNRGSFYGCLDEQGELNGVALIGHITQIETRTQAALEAFACLAQNNAHAAHLILGESQQVSRVQQFYAEAGYNARRIYREALLEQRWPVQVREVVRGLRPAVLDDLTHVMPSQAAMAYEESGVNPLKADPLGFRLRCARRIEQNRVWVWVEDGRLLFKADIMSDTPEVVYLEGIYVAPEERGKGYGQRCLSQLSYGLLTRVPSLCLLVNEQNRYALNFYARAGYKPRGCFNTIYLDAKADANA